MVSLTLQQYIQQDILPLYEHFDAAHRCDHALSVIEQSMQLATHYDVRPDMVYVIAAFHDTGLCFDRKNHHLHSGHIIRLCQPLREWFCEDEIETMAQAAEDHRASCDHEPRSIYGKIVAEADRLINTDTIIRRTLQYGREHYPELACEQQIQRAICHLHEKYGRNGYLQLWIPESPNAERLHALWDLIDDEAALLKKVTDTYNTLFTV